MSEQNGEVQNANAGAPQDAAGVADEVFVEVRGPDPEVWGNDADRPTAATSVDSPGLDGVWFEGTANEVRGPDSAVWAQDSEGNYINR